MRLRLRILLALSLVVSTACTRASRAPERDPTITVRNTPSKPPVPRLEIERPARLTDLTIDFPYRDRTLLRRGQQNGGRIWVPALAQGRGPVPLVVLLHGIDKGRTNRLHRLLRPGHDVTRALIPHLASGRLPPLVVAAPSQTVRSGRARTLWTPDGFDLADFVRAVEKQLARHGQARIDRSRIAVFGHSGAGCSPSPRRPGGLFGVVKNLARYRQQGLRVRLLGLMDTCFFGSYGAHLLRQQLAGTGVRVLAMYTTPYRWGSPDYRRIHAFRHALGATRHLDCNRSRYASCRENADGWQVFHARPRALRHAFAPLTPHSALPLLFVEDALLSGIPLRSSTDEIKRRARARRSAR